MVPSFQFHLISAVSCALFPSCSLCSSPASYFHRSRACSLCCRLTWKQPHPLMKIYLPRLHSGQPYWFKCDTTRKPSIKDLLLWQSLTHGTFLTMQLVMTLPLFFFFIPWLSWLYLVFLHPQIIWWNNLKIEMILWTNLQACTPFRKKMFLRSYKQKMLRAT